MSPYISGECCVPETSGEVHLMGECVPFRREYCNSYNMYMYMGPACARVHEGWRPSKNRAAILACCALSRNHGAPRLAL